MNRFIMITFALFAVACSNGYSDLYNKVVELDERVRKLETEFKETATPRIATPAPKAVEKCTDEWMVTNKPELYAEQVAKIDQANADIAPEVETHQLAGIELFMSPADLGTAPATLRKKYRAKAAGSVPNCWVEMSDEYDHVRVHRSWAWWLGNAMENGVCKILCVNGILRTSFIVSHFHI